MITDQTHDSTWPLTFASHCRVLAVVLDMEFDNMEADKFGFDYVCFENGDPMYPIQALHTSH